LVGVVYQPYKNAKKEGLKGAIKGSLYGLSGLIFKPVTALLDITSKTVEGIKSDIENNTLQHYEYLNKRSRNIRVFYSIN